MLFVHGSARNPLNEYVFPEDIYNKRKLEKIFALVPQYAFQGHTHVPGVFTESFNFFSPEELDNEYRLGQEKAMINVGSVGQPRDGNPRSCYVVLEDGVVRFRRVEYPLETDDREDLRDSRPGQFPRRPASRRALGLARRHTHGGHYAMERRFVLFLVSAFARALLGYHTGYASRGSRPRRRATPQGNAAQPAAKSRSAGRRQARKAAKASEKPAAEKPAAEAAAGRAGNQGGGRARGARTMGHPRLGRRRHDPYRMLVTLEQPRGGRGADRVEQPALLRHRQPQRLSGPVVMDDDPQRMSGAGGRARARPPPRPD